MGATPGTGSAIRQDLKLMRGASLAFALMTAGFIGYHGHQTVKDPPRGVPHVLFSALYALSLRQQFRAMARRKAYENGNPPADLSATRLYNNADQLWNWAKPLGLVAADGLLGPVSNPLIGVFGLSQSAHATAWSYISRNHARKLEAAPGEN